MTYNKANFDSQYRPFIQVNRPIYLPNSYKFGTASSVTSTWRLRDTVDMNIEMKYIRRGELNENGEIMYRFITGGEASPISYNKIYTDTSVGIAVKNEEQRLLLLSQGVNTAADKDGE